MKYLVEMDEKASYHLQRKLECSVKNPNSTAVYPTENMVRGAWNELITTNGTYFFVDFGWNEKQRRHIRFFNFFKLLLAG